MSERQEVIDLYGASYAGFESELYGDVRREAWGEEVGQTAR